MQISFFSLNIEEGKRIQDIIKFVKKNDFDIVSFQEVTGGRLSETGVNCFEQLKEELSHDGEIAVTLRAKEDNNSYVGNATFFKDSFFLIQKEIIRLKPYTLIDATRERNFEEEAKCALSLVFDVHGLKFRVINVHLAWGPDPGDTEEKIRQGKILVEYMKKIKEPFILSGDFNVDNNSQIVQFFDKLAHNITVSNNIVNTLNPNLHRAQHLFPPGLAVDFLYVSKSIKVLNFEVVKDNLSDHLGLATTIEL